MILREFTKPCKCINHIWPAKPKHLKIYIYLIVIGWHHNGFFNDVFSNGGLGSVWHTLRAFYDGDAYLALSLHSQLIDQAVSTHIENDTFMIC